MKNSKFILSLMVCLLAAGGCKKSDSLVDTGVPNGGEHTVYIVNEGNYGKGNASLTVYLPDSLKTYQDVFATANNRNLGDVGNDMVIWGPYGYIVVNNSQKIEVVALATMKSVGTITIPGSKSPFKAAIFSDTKGYVTNLYDNSVTVFNPTTFAIVKDRIPVGVNPQGIIAAGGMVYVCNSGYGADSTVSVIDPMTDTVVKTIVTGRSPSEIGADSQGNLIVKCDGVSSYPDPAKESSGSIVKIDPSTRSVAGSLPLPLAEYGHPEKIAVSTADFAYVKVKNGIMKMETRRMTVVNSAFVPFTSFSINGMAFDKAKDLLFVADAVDYVSAGTVTVYDGSGATVTTFKTGIIPGTIVILER